jgi:hypothetical protein
LIIAYLTFDAILNFYFSKSLLFIIKIGGFFMDEYFQIIRQALSEGRKKGVTYYEAHHIIPRSFGKKSSTVLLTPEEHYKCHKLLAEYFKNHTLYGRKMLWAFHRISYDGKRKLTEEEYGEVRRMLLPLWVAKKTDKHKENIRKTRVGKKTIVHPETNEIKYVKVEELQRRLGEGWENTNYKKGRVGLVSEEGKKRLAESRRKEQTGKTGLAAQAAKGPYTVEFIDGTKYTEGSYPELSKATGIPFATLQYRYVHKKGQMFKGWCVY